MLFPGDLRWKLQRWTAPPGLDVKANAMDQKLSINVDTGEIHGNARPATDEETKVVCNVIKKLGSFSKLNDIGLEALNGLGAGVKAENEREREAKLASRSCKHSKTRAKTIRLWNRRKDEF